MSGIERFVARLAGALSAADPAAPRPYDERDRCDQLQRCMRLSTELAELHARNGHPARAYRAMGDQAQALLDDGFAKADLQALARLLPPAPMWMNPKAVDSGVPVDPWQREATGLHSRLAEVALELRATGRYGRER